MSYKIRFSKPIKYVSSLGFYDNEPRENNFYEKEYSLINPTWHKDDAEAKFQSIKNGIEIGKKFIKVKNIADFGCGSCSVLLKTLNYSHQAIDKKISAVGIDISSNILANGEKHSQLIKVRSNCEHTPLVDKSISIALCIDLIEHIDNPNSLLREISRISQIAIFKIPIELSVFTNIKGGKKRLMKLEKKYGHIHHFDRTAIIRLVENYFNIINETYQKIPNRVLFLDKLQDIIIYLKLYKLFSIVFGGFIILVAKSKDRGELNVR